MSVTTVEGVIKNGKVVVSEEYKLPESAKVYVLVPDLPKHAIRVRSPRLVDPTTIKEFEREIIDIDENEI